MYSSDIIEEVISRNDIVDVISESVKLKKAGSSYQGLCPFHNEKTPSFSVSGQKQIFRCFGCGKGGNVITFVMEYDSLSFPEAVKSLADRVGMTLPEQKYTNINKENRDKKQKLLEIHKIAATYYYMQLKDEEGKAGLEYLRKRGLSGNTINRYGLGFAPQKTGELYKKLKAEGYDDELLKESGIFTYEGEPRDKFWNRVIFPIMNTSNKVIGFGGRVMGDAKPKYLNSPETLIFEKSKNLYGLNIAKNSRTGNMLICEGYMDVIALHQAGFTQAVASLGTALTEEHARILKRYTDTVYITYDSDEAGVKAALRAIPMFKEVRINTKVINMQPYKDPDEFIKNLGAQAFQERIDKAMGSFMFEISVLEKNYDRSQPDEETLFQKAIVKKLLNFEMANERNNYIKKIAHDYSIDEVGLKEMVAQIGKEEGITKKKPQYTNQQGLDNRNQRNGPNNKKVSGIRKAERTLLTTIIDNPELYPKVREYISPEDFVDELLSEVAKRIFTLMDEKKNVNVAAIIGGYESEELQREITALFTSELNEELSKEERKRALNEIVIRIKTNKIENEIYSTTDGVRLQELFKKRQEVEKIKIII